MIILAVGVVLFVALHGVAAIPPLKAWWKSHSGEKWYGASFGIASVIALAVIVLGWRSSAFVAVYEPRGRGWYVNYLLTFISFLCLGIFLFRGKLRQTLRFPMAIAAIFWATGHLFANGDVVCVHLRDDAVGACRHHHAGVSGDLHLHARADHGRFHPQERSAGG